MTVTITFNDDTTKEYFIGSAEEKSDLAEQLGQDDMRSQFKSAVVKYDDTEETTLQGRVAVDGHRHEFTDMDALIKELGAFGL